MVGLVALVLLGACSQQDQRPTDEHTSKQPERVVAPTWHPLSTGDVPAREPTAVSGRPSLNAAHKAAERAPDRTAGEQFALAAVHLILDVRPRTSGEAVMETIASPSLDPEVRAYLVDDIDGQQAVGTQRRIDTSLSTWIRSRLTGESGGTARVEVELFCSVRSDPMDFSNWDGTRIDVQWEDGRWRMVDYADGSPGEFSDAELTPAQRKKLLTGPGWRRLPPAD